MATSRMHIYFLFFLILIINGCNCGNADPDDDLVLKNCADIDKVSKKFTFEIYAKYRYNNEPIQNEGEVIVYATIIDYIYSKHHVNESFCFYEESVITDNYVKNFDQSGKAIITLDEFEFDNKYDRIFFYVQVSFPSTSDIEAFANTQYGAARYDSPESSVLFFSYKSDLDL